MLGGLSKAASHQESSNLRIYAKARPIENSQTEGSHRRDPRILLLGRPVLLIQDDDFDPADAETDFWRDLLLQHRDRLRNAIKCVGRIELRGDRRFDWIGTGWVITHDIIVTIHFAGREQLANFAVMGAAARSPGRNRPLTTSHRPRVRLHHVPKEGVQATAR